MALVITKKTRTILLIILAVLVVGGGGFLIWRVTREETVAPKESEAGGGAGACCIEGIGCVAGYRCDMNQKCTSCEKAYVGGMSGKSCGTNAAGQTVFCRSYFHCENPNTNTCCPDSNANLGTCIPESGPPSEGECKDVKCEWPTVVMSHLNCACKRCDEVSGVCSGDPEKCSPPSCPSGYVSCGVSGDHENTPECKKNTSKYCWGNHQDCNNPFVVYRYCKPEAQESENTCEGGHWVNKPSGQYEYGTKLNPITVRNTDPDGLGEVTITLNGSNIIQCGTVVGTTCYSTDGNDIELLIDPGIQYITPDTYNLTISWKDGKGVGGSNCTLSTSFTILEEQREPSCGDGILDQGEECEQGDPDGYSCLWSECNQDTCTCIEEPTCGDGILDQGEECELGDPNGYSCLWDVCNQNTCLCPEVQENPDWTITKEGIGECIVENEITYAKGTYTITVTNVGEGEGSIDKIVDELDEKVLEEYLNEISNGGAYTSRIITWDLEGEEETFSPEESMQFTYYIKIPQEDYGIYRNTVTAYPIQGDNFIADKSLDLTCDIVEKEEIPQTGIFDNVVNRIILGVIFILLGSNWGSVTNTILKLNYSRKEYLSDQRMKRFERKVVKDKDDMI
jgi:hypothetical protein